MLEFFSGFSLALPRLPRQPVRSILFNIPPSMDRSDKRMLGPSLSHRTVLWLLGYELWLLGSVRGASVRLDAGEFPIRWNQWQPWVCMCDLRKQARIRHFVMREPNATFALKTSEFWQEKPCSADACGGTCLPEECPGGGGGDGDSENARSSFARQFEGLSSPKPHEVEIPLPPETDLLPSYDSLPSVDDLGRG